MKHSPEHKKDISGAFYEEVCRVFGMTIRQQIRLPEHQKYRISIGAPILEEMQLEIRSKRHAPDLVFEPKRKLFSIQFTAVSKYEALIDRAFSVIQKRYPCISDTHSRANSDYLRNIHSITGEVTQDEHGEIANILGELAVAAYLASGRLISNNIRYHSGNMLVQDSAIPSTRNPEPYLQSGLTLDIRETRQHLKKPGSVPKMRTNEHLPWHRETLDHIATTQAKAALFLSIREPAYADPNKDTQFFQGYDDILEYVLPNEVCAYMVKSVEGSMFEVRSGNVGISEICLRIGSIDEATQERDVIFILSIDGTLGAKLLEDSQKLVRHIGKHEVELRNNPRVISDQEEPATITLETRILLDAPGKIRRVLGVFGKLLHEHGSLLQSTPEICRSFGNQHGSLQFLAHEVSIPKEKPPVDR